MTPEEKLLEYLNREPLIRLGFEGEGVTNVFEDDGHLILSQDLDSGTDIVVLLPEEALNLAHFIIKRYGAKVN